MRFYSKRIIIGIVFLLIGWTVSAITLESVSSGLVCQCGCGLVLNNCNHIDCGVAVPMRNTISEMIDAGETDEQIAAYFVSQYGEVVLAAPTKQGFNLTAWLFPFIGILIGAVVIVLTVLTWVRRRNNTIIDNEETIEISISSSGKKNKYESIFEREFKDFD